MADKCTGCGAGIRKIEGIGTDWETVIYTCGTGEDSGYFGRECWANQCAAMHQLVREIRDLVIKYQGIIPPRIWNEVLNRPEVRAIMGGEVINLPLSTNRPEIPC